MSKIENQPMVSVQSSDLEIDTREANLNTRTKSRTIVEPDQSRLTERAVGKKLNETHPTKPIFDALQNDDMDTFERLLNPASHNQFNPMNIAWDQNDKGETLLHLAVAQGNIKAVMILQNAYPYPMKNIPNREMMTINDYISKQSEQFRGELNEAEQRREKDNINNLFRALETNNLDLFTFSMDRIDRQKIGEARNEEGQTLTHLAIEKQNIPAFLEIRRANEGALDTIKNAQGETAADYIQKQGTDFIKRLEAGKIEQAKKYGFAQRELLEKSAKFLKIRAEVMKQQGFTQTDPRLEHIKEIELIINDMLSRGHCRGFELAWAEMFTVNMESEFSKGLTLLKDWDGESEHVTAELTNMIDDLFQRIIFYQHTRTIPKILNTDPTQSLLPVYQDSELSKFLDNPQLFIPIEQLKVNLQLIPIDILSSLLKEGTTIEIAIANKHAIAIGHKNGAYYLYDSNYRGSEKNFDMDKLAVKFDSLEDLSKSIRHQLWETFNKKGTMTEYILSVIDHKKNNHHYPSQKEMTDRVRIFSLEADQSLTQFDRINKFLSFRIKDLNYLTKLLSSMSREQLNDKSQGATILDSFIYQSPSPFINEAIKMILNKGGEITPGEYGSLFNVIMAKHDPEIIRMIYDADPQQRDSLTEEFKKTLDTILEQDQS